MSGMAYPITKLQGPSSFSEATVNSTMYLDMFHNYAFLQLEEEEAASYLHDTAPHYGNTVHDTLSTCEIPWSLDSTSRPSSLDPNVT